MNKGKKFLSKEFIWGAVTAIIAIILIKIIKWLEIFN